MTGYGKATCKYKNKNINIEIRAVNSKQIDINPRIPMIYKEKELEIRSELIKQIERGKVDIYISIEQHNPEAQVQINKELLKEYFRQIKTIATELNVPVNEHLLITALRFPEILKSDTPSLNENEVNILFECLKEAINLFNQFRIQEGRALEKDIKYRIALIEQHLSEIQNFEQNRIKKIKEKLHKTLNDFIPAESIEATRFEQEIIYYLEKLDITEEKVRLKNHIDYFLETLNADTSAGRKLIFIIQEMGREINTIGSKANDSDIQKIVVILKDELEKIKEQLLNVL